MPKDFKYTSRNNDQLKEYQISLLSDIHSLAKSRGIPRNSFNGYKFDNYFDQTLYDLLLQKVDDVTKQMRYRIDFQKQFHDTYDTSYNERISKMWKPYWSKQKSVLTNRYGSKFQKGNKLYKEKKGFWRNIYNNTPFEKYNRYGYLDYKYKYDTRGYKWRRYKLDNNNNFEYYLD